MEVKDNDGEKAMLFVVAAIQAGTTAQAKALRIFRSRMTRAGVSKCARPSPPLCICATTDCVSVLVHLPTQT